MGTLSSIRRAVGLGADAGAPTFKFQSWRRLGAAITLTVSAADLEEMSAATHGAALAEFEAATADANRRTDDSAAADAAADSAARLQEHRRRVAEVQGRLDSYPNAIHNAVIAGNDPTQLEDEYAKLQGELHRLQTRTLILERHADVTAAGLNEHRRREWTEARRELQEQAKREREAAVAAILAAIGPLLPRLIRVEHLDQLATAQIQAEAYTKLTAGQR